VASLLGHHAAETAPRLLEHQHGSLTLPALLQRRESGVCSLPRRVPHLPPADPEYLQSLIDGEPMATMTIRNIDDHLKARLRVRAAQHGRSMEDEARDILRAALSSHSNGPVSLVDSIRARIEPLGGVDLVLPPRETLRTPPEFEG